MHVVTVYLGAGFEGAPPAFHFRATGSIDQILEGARIKCGQALATRGQQSFVELHDSDGVLVAYEVFDADCLA